jgi:hypothetical protein
LDYENRSEHKILVQGEDITGVKVINNFTISVNDLNESTSIYAHKMNDNVKILPNPGSGIFKLNFSENLTLNSGNNAEIYNLKGGKIADVSLKIVSKNQSMIDLSSFSEGIYFLVLKIDNEMTSVKFVITKQ